MSVEPGRAGVADQVQGQSAGESSLVWEFSLFYSGLQLIMEDNLLCSKSTCLNVNIIPEILT